MNWGKSIIGIYALFVVGILFLVYKATQQKFELVSPNYYQQEIQFQSEIDAESNANKLGISATIVDSSQTKLLVIKSQALLKDIKGKASFYCAANSKNDTSILFEGNNKMEFNIPQNSLKPGRYQVKIRWKSASYLNQEFQNKFDYTCQ